MKHTITLLATLLLAPLVELYDHQSDPQENTNIANDPANKALVEKLTAQWLAGWKGAMAKP